MPKLLHIANLDPERSTGPNISVVSLSQALDEELSTSSHIRGPGDALADIRGFDLCIFHGVWNPLFWKAAALCREIGVPYVVTPRSSLMRRSLTRNARVKLKNSIKAYRFLKYAERIHFLNDEEASNSIKFHQQYFVVPNGCHAGHPERFENKRGDPASHQDDDWKILLFLGRLDVHHKGLDSAVEAVAGCKAELIKRRYRVIIAGDDFKGGGEKLKYLIASKKLEDVITVCPRRFRGDEKKELLSQASGFFHTSRYEGEPQAVIEALCIGKPCLVTRGTNLMATVMENSFGLAVGNRPEEIAQGFRDLIDLIEHGGVCNRHRQSFRFSRSWQAIGRLTLSHYVEVISENAKNQQ